MSFACGKASSSVTISCFVAANPSLMGLEALADEGGFVPFHKAARTVIQKDNKSLKHSHPSSVFSVGDALRALSIGVSLGKTFHTSHSVFFPQPLKSDTVSHLVRVWNIGKVEALSGPKDIATHAQGYSVHSFQIHR